MRWLCHRFSVAPEARCARRGKRRQSRRTPLHSGARSYSNLQLIADLLVLLLTPAGLTAIGLVLAGLLVPRLGASAFRAFERALARVIHRRFVLACAVLAFAVYAAAGLVRLPIPMVHDEFSNLLAADTFLHGRLANPPHPYWRHFETNHVLVQPVYASKYQPGYGAVLAAGRLLGHPVIGVWLVMAAIAAVLAWGLGAWLPKRWAALGALLAVSHPLVFSWGQAYWGGALALLGSALVTGGAARLFAGNTRPWTASLGIACGLAVLGLSRPYDGAALVLGVLIATVMFHRRRIASVFKPLALTCLAVLGPLAAFLLFYNSRLTGDPLVLPYALYARRYLPAPLFVWDQRPARPIVAPADMQRIYEVYAKDAERQRTLRGWARETARKARRMREDALSFPASVIRWFPALLLLPLPLLLARRRDVRAAVVVVLVVLAAIFCITSYGAYYLAVLFPPLALLWVASLRHLRGARMLGRRPGLLWSRMFVGAWIVSLAMEIHARREVPSMWQGAVDRERIQRQLEVAPGRDLVFVRYGPNHFPHMGWTYNVADIDASPVIWARSLSDDENRALAAYYRDRMVWVVYADEGGRLVRLR